MAASRAQMTVEERARRVKLLLFDVDGVLTDGIVVMHADGSESKGFHIKDGAAIVWAQRSGLPVGLLSSRSSGATAHRAAQLAVRIVQQGVASKSAAFDQILSDANITEDAVSYMGDDLLDLPVLTRCGLSAAPADAVEEVRSAVDWVSTAAGGRGAVRELIEIVLRAQGRWAAVVAEHGGRH
jgi:3-deoxy-D-manno-octulosonate 8-phosphate phosphatase (KDO 8-P phosphatase)